MRTYYFLLILSFSLPKAEAAYSWWSPAATNSLIASGTTTSWGLVNGSSVNVTQTYSVTQPGTKTPVAVRGGTDFYNFQNAGWITSEYTNSALLALGGVNVFKAMSYWADTTAVANQGDPATWTITFQFSAPISQTSLMANQLALFGLGASGKNAAGTTVSSVNYVLAASLGVSTVSTSGWKMNRQTTGSYGAEAGVTSAWNAATGTISITGGSGHFYSFFTPNNSFDKLTITGNTINYDTFDVGWVSSTPELSTCLMIGAGLLVLGLARRHRISVTFDPAMAN